MERQVADLHFSAWGSHHSVIFLHLTVLNEAKVSIGQQHPKHAFFFGVINGKNTVGIDMVKREWIFLLFELWVVFAAIITKKRERVIVSKQGKRIMPRQFYDLPKRMFPMLCLFIKGMHQQATIFRVKRNLTRWRSQPVRLRKILQKLCPLNGVTVINIYLLKQLHQLITNKMRFLLRFIQCLSHEP